MVDIKKWKKCVWETRKTYGRAFLKKSQLAEAYKLYCNVEGNKERFNSLLKDLFIAKHGG